MASQPLEMAGFLKLFRINVCFSKDAYIPSLSHPTFFCLFYQSVSWLFFLQKLGLLFSLGRYQCIPFAMRTASSKSTLAWLEPGLQPETHPIGSHFFFGFTSQVSQVSWVSLPKFYGFSMWQHGDAWKISVCLSPSVMTSTSSSVGNVYLGRGRGRNRMFMLGIRTAVWHWCPERNKTMKKGLV